LDQGIRYGGTSTCYRKEAGKHGIDTNGIFRVHQFEKVEQLCYCQPGGSNAMHDQMLECAKSFYDSLGLSYRVIAIVSGALNNSATKKYDIEGWFCGSKSYKELVSCSNCTDFFSKRLNVRNKRGEYVHILNSTLCANTRTICCMLEQYQTDQGVVVPEVLRKYVGKDFLKYIE
jgi:seryl-tRNA synthetase